MADARSIQLGIVGCGNVLTAYGPAIDQLRSRNLAHATVACGRDAQRDFAGSQLGPVRFTTNPEDVFHSPDVDAVLILTSMSEHASLACAALEAGKHVLLEKPHGHLAR